MSRKIKSLGVKMVLSGEGSDEIFGGYLYFHKAPNKKEFHEETCRKVIKDSIAPGLSFKLLRTSDGVYVQNCELMNLLK
jgi:hypothetical protein